MKADEEWIWTESSATWQESGRIANR